jgi:methylenetetrahydrofolate--tRNA-(uracil-5-)-methyltransferase
MAEVVNVVGGGLAGVEAAWQAAELGAKVRLYEMRPVLQTPAHRTDKLAEIVCSNSLKTDEPGSAPYLLKEELRRGKSLVMEVAAATRVPAGAALSVDRIKFAEIITARIEAHPNIEIVREEIRSIADCGLRNADSVFGSIESSASSRDDNETKSAVRNPRSAIEESAIRNPRSAIEESSTIVATGPLTSNALTESIMKFTGDDQLYFYDAIAPIVAADSIDMSIAFKAARYGKGGDDYINCPMNREQYEIFINELLVAKSVPLKEIRRDKVVRIVSADRRDRTSRRRHASIRSDEAERFAGSENRIRSVCVRPASTGKSHGRCVRAGRISESPPLRRTGPSVEIDPGFGERGVPAVRADPSQHVHQLAEDIERRSVDTN